MAGPPSGGPPRPGSPNRTAVSLAAAALVAILITVVLVVATSDKNESATSTATTRPSTTTASTRSSTSSSSSSSSSRTTTTRRSTNTTNTTGSTVPSSTIPGGLALDESCTSSEYGYSLLYPGTWFAELYFAGWDCGLFDAHPFQVQPQTEVPPVAVLAAVYEYSFDMSVASYTDPSYNMLLSSSDMTIAGRKAVAVEIVTTEDMMEPSGTSRYAVLVDWGGNRTFIIETSSARGDDYTIDKQVVRAMAQTVTLPG